MGLSDKYQKPNMLKPLFITLNTLAYAAYIIAFLAFILSKKSSDTSTDVIDDSSWLSTFYRVVSGINGLCFFLLTVSLLNYGSRLEKIVHAIRVKGQHQAATNEFTDQINGSGSSHNIPIHFTQVDLTRELPQVSGAEPNKQKTVMSNLD